MSEKRSRKNVPVRRITVDERVADDLVRLAICPLAEGVEEFFDKELDWGEEEEDWAQPENYVEKLGIPPEKRAEWTWEKLREGLVFLSGEFESIATPKATGHFRVSPGQKAFWRIDNLDRFKQSVKQVYSDVLTRRLKDGNPD